MSSLSAVIVNWNTRDMLHDCLSSLHQGNINEIIVVDNDSSDGSPEMVEGSFPDVILVRNPKNYGYAKAANIGFSKCSGEIILLLNSDIIMQPGSLKVIREYMEHGDKLKIASPVLHSAEGRVLENVRPIPSFLFMLLHYLFIFSIFPFLKNILPKYLQAAVYVLNREVIERLHGFDERFFFYAEDVDFCLRAKKQNIRISLIHESHATHLCGVSSKKRDKFKYYIMNLNANLLFLDKFYPESKVAFIRSIIIFHFTLKTFLASLLLPLKKNKQRLFEKLQFYKRIAEQCRTII